jgi:hypothetical protein
MHSATAKLTHLWRVVDCRPRICPDGYKLPNCDFYHLAIVQDRGEAELCRLNPRRDGQDAERGWSFGTGNPDEIVAKTKALISHMERQSVACFQVVG